MPSNDPNTSSAWARWIRILGNRWAVIRAMIPIDSSLNEIFTEDNPAQVGGEVTVGGIVDVSGSTVNIGTVAAGPFDTNIAKQNALVTVVIPNVAALSNPFDIRPYSGGNVYIPAVWTNADIGFYGAPTLTGTYVPLYDDNGNVQQSTVGAVTSRLYSFPPEIFACRFIKLWSQLAGVNEVQGGDRTMIVELKA